MKKTFILSLSLLFVALAAPATYGMEGKKPVLPGTIRWLACYSGITFGALATYTAYATWNLGKKNEEIHNELKETKNKLKAVKRNLKETVRDHEHLGMVVQDLYVNFHAHTLTTTDEIEKELDDSADDIISHDFRCHRDGDNAWTNGQCRKELYWSIINCKAENACRAEKIAWRNAWGTTDIGAQTKKYHDCLDKVKQAFGKI